MTLKCHKLLNYLGLPCQFIKIKAVKFNVFKLTMDQMTICNVKGITCNDTSTDNYIL